jgi:intracellular septation protein
VTEKTASSPSNARLLIDAGPIGVWIVVYNLSRMWFADEAIYIGTGAYMLAATIAMLASVRIEKRVPPMLVMTTVIVLGFGAMGIWLQDPIFIYVKPTIINLFLSWLILVSMALRMNVWKIFFQHLFTLPDEAWTVFSVRWAIWFQFLALLNEFLWRHIGDGTVSESARWFADFSITESFWANSKLAILFLGMGFMLAQMPLLMKYQAMAAEDAEADADEKKDA